MIPVTVMLKSGGYRILQITPEMLSELAVSIKEKGSEIVSLKSGPLEVVGFLVTGIQTGERIIVHNKPMEATQ